MVSSSAKARIGSLEGRSTKFPCIAVTGRDNEGMDKYIQFTPVLHCLCCVSSPSWLSPGKSEPDPRRSRGSKEKVLFYQEIPLEQDQAQIGGNFVFSWIELCLWGHTEEGIHPVCPPTPDTICKFHGRKAQAEVPLLILWSTDSLLGRLLVSCSFTRNYSNWRLSVFKRAVDNFWRVGLFEGCGSSK